MIRAGRGNAVCTSADHGKHVQTEFHLVAKEHWQCSDEIVACIDPLATILSSALQPQQ